VAALVFGEVLCCLSPASCNDDDEGNNGAGCGNADDGHWGCRRLNV